HGLDLHSFPTRRSSDLERKAPPAEFTAESIEAQTALASQPAAKIAVKGEGWYRVTQPELVAVGFDARINPRLLQLFVGGRELPRSEEHTSELQSPDHLV